MASSSTCLLPLGSSILIFSLVFLASSCFSEENIGGSSTLTITLPLTSTFRSKPSSPENQLTDASTSSSRSAHHRPKHVPPFKTFLFPHTLGFHSIFLSVGTPPQKLSYIVDTGGSAVEAPCTAKYTCTNCSFSASGPNKLPIFYPERSSSSKTLDCRNPKCARYYSSDVHFRCPICGPNSKNCTNDCPYVLEYATGTSYGHFLLENLQLPLKTKRNFQFGCTTSAARQVTTAALAGFDKSTVSLPVQMGVKKFAYCLKSHDYDETNNAGRLILDFGGGVTKGLSHAPFLRNPRQSPNYYYLGVKGIKIGDKLLPVPSKYLSPGPDGRHGVIIDSGFGGGGYMTEAVIKIVTNELKKRLSKYKRAPEIEAVSGFSPCFNFTGHKSMKIPDLAYEFTGGEKMVVAAKNYFLFDHEGSIACFYIRTATSKGLEFTPAPSVIIGNSLQVDYYMEYDLKNRRLGFRPQDC